MTLSSKRHDVVIQGMSVTVELASGLPRTWQLAVGGTVVDRVATDADCVLRATLPKEEGSIRAVVQQHDDGSVRIKVLHEGQEVVTFNDAVEAE
ncbi:MAG TPA: hypothetical protein VFL99_04490 [Segeticoccus sp.]|uniref:hypothetical protein n=1 Tax=Segeticoccus sp. TaxID=2706531 RepID=UPI002D7E1A8B|nr:hypothetical protein [Segeticoccus sp.]HET8599562.1 hypothetical protein [Segeticoccus sp.]